MANRTFAQLPAITSTNSADKVPIWDESGGVAAHITIANLAPDIIDASGIAGHVADESIHRAIDDSGSATTVLWSANKIAAEIAANVPTGVLLADGSVSMAGNFNLADNLLISDDADSLHLFGRAAVGDAGVADSAFFSHRDFMSATEHGFRQTNLGSTVVNSAGAAFLYLRQGNENRIVLTSGRVDFYAPIDLRDNGIDSDDADLDFALGRTSIGHDGANADRAIFAHRDHATSTGFLVAQDADGAARFNTATGKPMRFSIGGSEKITMDLNGRLGVGEAGPETHLHIKGADAGAVGSPGDTYAIFENSGNTGIQIRSGASNDSSIHFGSTNGSSMAEIRYSHLSNILAFRVNNNPVLAMRSIGLTPEFDNAYDLGNISFRFDDVYATNSTIQTSDRNQKKAIKDSVLGLDFINALRPVSYKWRSTPERKSKKALVGGGSERTHYGLIAQEVKSVLEKLSISTEDFAGYIESDNNFGLRYGEFIAPMARAIQELDEKFEAFINGNSR